jgi:hypothetical protein
MVNRFPILPSLSFAATNATVTKNQSTEIYAMKKRKQTQMPKSPKEFVPSSIVQIQERKESLRKGDRRCLDPPKLGLEDKHVSSASSSVMRFVQAGESTD